MGALRLLALMRDEVREMISVTGLQGSEADDGPPGVLMQRKFKNKVRNFRVTDN